MADQRPDDDFELANADDEVIPPGEGGRRRAIALGCLLAALVAAFLAWYIATHTAGAGPGWG